MTAEREWPVVEILASMQGGGANTGKPAVFLRLGGAISTVRGATRIFAKPGG